MAVQSARALPFNPSTWCFVAFQQPAFTLSRLSSSWVVRFFNVSKPWQVRNTRMLVDSGEKWDVYCGTIRRFQMCVQVCIDEVHQPTVLVLDTSSSSLCMASPCCHYPAKNKVFEVWSTYFMTPFQSNLNMWCSELRTCGKKRHAMAFECEVTSYEIWRLKALKPAVSVSVCVCVCMCVSNVGMIIKYPI